MEIIRRHSDYAIRALLYLAQIENGDTSCSRLAKDCDIPKSFAHKILKKATNAGLVASRTGRAGGFQLARDPGKIALRDIIEVIQGPIVVARCVFCPETCARRKECPLSREWCAIQARITGFLKRTTLLHVLRSVKRAGTRPVALCGPPSVCRFKRRPRSKAR